jgi:peptidoglycan/LPS O-acetylase OafA/YrhL
MTAPAEPAPRRHRRHPHLPGLDGLRGLAVLGVLAFHSDWRWASGGFLGVSLFFTLSGFLIARLLLIELDEHRTIDLARFFSRRARRLLPAAFAAIALAMLVTVTAGTASQRADIGGDVAGSVLYVVNWWFLLAGDSYLDLFDAASPLQHMWSLAIEEQLYLFVPLMLLAAGTVGGRRGVAVAVGVATVALAGLGAATSSSVAVDTLYYGTHVRAVELLIGVGLAIATAGSRRRPGRLVRGAGATVLLASILASWATVSAIDGGLFRGPIVLHALATAALIWAVTGGDSVVSPVLGWRPLEWIGRRSYGIYVYHWPLFLYAEQRFPRAPSAATLSLSWAATFLLASASYRFLEQPVRLGDAIRRPRTAGALALVLPGLLVVAGLAATSAATAPTNVRAAADRLDELTSATTATTSTSTSTTSTTLADQPAPPVVPPPPSTEPPRLAVFGDSTAATLGLGLVRWAQETGRFTTVPGSAIPGCSLVTEGSRWSDDTEFTIPEGCEWRDRWAQLAAEHRPHVAVVSTGALDALPWSLPGVEGRREITDPEIGRRVLAEMEDVNEVLTAAGARVFWLTLPGPVREGANTARVRRLNELVREAAEDQPGVHVVDVGAHVDRWPTDLDEQRRRDGVHLDEGPAFDLAAGFLGPRLLALSGGVITAPAGG